MTDGRNVALRVIPNALLASDEPSRRRWPRTCGPRRRVSHPNGVKVLAPRRSRGPARASSPSTSPGRNFAEVIRKGNRTTPHAGPQHRVRAGPVPRRRPRPGPRPRVHPAVQHHGGGRGGEGRGPRPRPPRPGRALRDGLPRAGARPRRGGRPLRAGRRPLPPDHGRRTRAPCPRARRCRCRAASRPGCPRPWTACSCARSTRKVALRLESADAFLAELKDMVRLA